MQSKQRQYNNTHSRGERVLLSLFTAKFISNAFTLNYCEKCNKYVQFQIIMIFDETPVEEKYVKEILSVIVYHTNYVCLNSAQAADLRGLSDF